MRKKPLSCSLEMCKQTWKALSFKLLFQAAKRSRLDAEFEFAPSDEFSISPVRQSNPTELAPPLETKESGEILLEDGPRLAKPQDPEILKARREKAKMLGLKQESSGSQHPDPGIRHDKPPDTAAAQNDQDALDEFDVHFSP